jgi:hypothetical protein
MVWLMACLQVIVLLGAHHLTNLVNFEKGI